MKVLERLALVVFSIVMLVMSVISCLVISNILKLEDIFEFIKVAIANNKVSMSIIIFSIISILLAVKALFFPSKVKKRPEVKTGVLLENKDGRLLISKSTIENLIGNIAESFEGAIDVQTKVFLSEDNDITVFISLLVSENAIIKELSANIQNSIKEIVKRNTDLDVTQVNINIRNIEDKKENTSNQNQSKIKISNIKVNNTKEMDTINEVDTTSSEEKITETNV